MKTIVFEINTAIEDSNVFKTINELRKLNIGSNMLRQDTYRLFVIKLPSNMSVDDMLNVLKIVVDTLLS